MSTALRWTSLAAILALAACRGQTGPQGPQGPQGAQGSQGPAGPPGAGVDGGLVRSDLYYLEWATYHAAAVGVCGAIDRDAGVVHDVIAYNPRTQSCSGACAAFRTNARCAAAMQISVGLDRATTADPSAGTYYSMLGCSLQDPSFTDNYELYPASTAFLTYYCCCS